MTTTAPPPTRPQLGPERRRPVALVAAAAVLITVLLVILLVGYVPLPEFPRLADQPDRTIPGTVALVRDVEDTRCLVTIPAMGGQVTDLTCRPMFEIGELAWTRDGRLTVTTWGPAGPELLVIDASSGAEVDRVPLREQDEKLPSSPQRLVRDDGARLLYEQRLGGHAVLRVRDASGTTHDVLDVTGPEDYVILNAQWSPDGAWILVSDSRGRVLVVDSAGAIGPRLLADSSGNPEAGGAWWIPGDPTYTVDPTNP